MPNKDKQYSFFELTAYSLLAFPISLVALPIYVNVPKFYAELGVSLSTIALPIILIRVLDAVQDPLIGVLSEKFKFGRGRARIILLSSPLLMLAMYLLFNPAKENIILLMCLSLYVCSLAHSIISINYESLGAELGRNYTERARITTTRETFGLVGVLLATMLPGFLVAKFGAIEGYKYFSVICVPIILIPTILAYWFSPQVKKIAKSQVSYKLVASFKTTLANIEFRWLAAIFVFNAVAASIPAAVVLFYVSDVLKIDDPIKGATFLFAYFFSGALGMPIWYYMAKRQGKRFAWLVSMIISIITFIGAFFLTAETANLFYLVCFFSGLALGADLSLPPAILADIVERSSHNNASSYFGVWNFLAKGNFALASAISLGLLQATGYTPHIKDNGVLIYLAAIYALLPCVLKIGAFIILKFSPLDKTKTRML